MTFSSPNTVMQQFILSHISHFSQPQQPNISRYKTKYLDQNRTGLFLASLYSKLSFSVFLVHFVVKSHMLPLVNTWSQLWGGWEYQTWRGRGGGGSVWDRSRCCSLSWNIDTLLYLIKIAYSDLFLTYLVHFFWNRAKSSKTKKKKSSSEIIYRISLPKM